MIDRKAQYRESKAKPKKDTTLTRARKSQDAPTRRQLRKATQEQMDKRLGKLRREA